MKYHGIEMKGAFVCEKVSTNPSWTSSDEGRLIHNTTDGHHYYGDDSGWVKLTTADDLDAAFALVTDTSPQLGGDLDTNGYLVKNGITLNKNVIDTSYTIPTGYNAMSVGPLDINATVIINENTTWEIL